MPRKHAAMAAEHFLFRDRRDAGEQLADRVARLRLRNPLILALPRGGVPVAIQIAETLRAPLDLLLVRKIGLPWQPELAVGAVLDGHTPHTLINQDVAQRAQMDEADITRIARIQFEEIEHRRRLWLNHREHLSIRNRDAVIVDDGVATGTTVRLALNAVRKEGAARLILACPVTPQHVAELLRGECDDAVFLATPKDLISVSMYYQDFHQLHDDEVKQLLNRAWANLPSA